ncbi:MAG: rhodanese-like domain-containing protein [Eubacterium sp.]
MDLTKRAALKKAAFFTPILSRAYPYYGGEGMNFEMITPKELDRYLHRGDTFIIDLRPPKEYRERHLKGAVNIPYEKLSGCCLFPRDRLLLFYCDRGSMSMAAAREYAEKSYRTKTVVGGFLAYQGRETESFR